MNIIVAKITSDKIWPTLKSRLQSLNLKSKQIFGQNNNRKTRFEKEPNVCVVIIMPIIPDKKTLELARS